MDRKKHVLVIGAGSIGERHIRCFLATDRARVSFVEPKSELRAAIAARYPETTAYEDLRPALDQVFDAAVIATPAPLHVGQATQLIERDIHVLIEKPLSISMRGVRRLCEVAAARSVTVGIAYVYRASPILAEMRHAVLQGQFGAPVELVAVCGQHFPHYRPAYRDTYYTRHETGGGAVQDALTHVINAGQWLLGPVDRVVSDLSHQVLEGVEVEDTAHVLARHGDIPASYTLNQHQAPNEVTITVVCERGTARCELHQNRWRCMTEPGDVWRDQTHSPLERDTLFQRQANQFLDAIDRGRPVACSLEEGVQTLATNLAILESAAKRAWQAVTVGELRYA